MNRSVDGWLAAAEPTDSERKIGDQIAQRLFILHDMRRDNSDNAFHPRNRTACTRALFRRLRSRMISTLRTSVVH